MNVYCQAQGISNQNFGVILDDSPELSQALVETMSQALSAGDDVESALCAFCNVHASEFGLSRSLSANDKEAIQQKFETAFRTVTATKENPHMDDFMILDTKAHGENAKFVSHQGLICTDFANIVDPTCPHQKYFEQIRKDAATRPEIITAKNEPVMTVDIEPEALLDKLSDVQWERLPKEIQEACRASPAFQNRQFLEDVAKGKQKEADAMLQASSDKQSTLRTPGKFTDYSGRTFHCTAFEYAYWAKDTHMCRMLETHMDEETKAHLLVRIDAIEEVGLPYQQNSTEHRSAHFDLTPLKTALQAHVDGYDAWEGARNWAAMEASWKNVGLAQRDVPAHVAQEYCRGGRSFDPCPSFNEPTLPRCLTFFNRDTFRHESWFPFASSNSGLGFDFGLARGASWEAEARRRIPRAWVSDNPWGWNARLVLAWSTDLAAITRLDEVRTAELTSLRENLSQPGRSTGMSL